MEMALCLRRLPLAGALRAGVEVMAAAQALPRARRNGIQQRASAAAIGS